jgi:DNA replication protein DnaC
VPARFVGKRLSDYDTSIGSSKVLDEVTSYIETFDGHRKTGLGLLFLGPPGRGKSLLSCIALNEVAAQGYNCFYTTYYAYVKREQSLFELRTAWEKTGDQDAYDEWQDVRRLVKAMRNEVDLLVLDDVGKEHKTTSRYAEDECDFLLRYRFDKGLPTIISSNMPVPSWGHRYGDSMESFLYEAFLHVTCSDTPDVRRARR